MIGIPLAEVVDGYMLKLGNDSPNRFPYYMAYAKAGLDIFHREVNGTLKAEQVVRNSNSLTIPLPNGCIKVAKVFSVNGLGGINQLSESDNIHVVDDNCGDPTTVPSNYGFGSNFDNSGNRHNKNGYNIGAYYGNGGYSAAGQYRINQAMGRIELSSSVQGRILIIEYIGRPERVGEDFVVHPYLTEALEEYIHSASLKFKRGVPLQERDYWENKWVMSMLQGKVDIYGMTAKQVEYAIAKNTTLTPKI
jgi:hypothetical protein